MSAKVAYVLLSLLSQTSHELDLSLSALLLFGPAPIESLIFPPEMREQSLHAYDSVESARWTIENILSSRALDAVLIESFASDCAGMSQAAKDGWLYHGMGFDCSEYLSTIWEKWQGLKVRVLVGSEDKVETVEKVREQTVQVLKAGGFDIEMDVVEGAGHLLPVEAIDEVVEALRKLVG